LRVSASHLILDTSGGNREGTALSASAMKQDLATELELARGEFHEMVRAVAPDHWDTPSANPAWTNGQLLAHIAFAYLLVLRLWRVLQVFGRFQLRWSKAFARALDASTPLYHRINAVLPRLIAHRYGPEDLTRRYDHVHAVILNNISQANDVTWRRRMHYPKRWDARFSDVMTFEDIARWSVAHLRHHRTQLRIASGESE
jgi:hypothetical protein